MSEEERQKECPHHLGWLRYEGRGAGNMGGLIRCRGCKKIWHCCPGTEVFLLHFGTQVEELRQRMESLVEEFKNLKQLVVVEEANVTVSQDDGDPVTYREVDALIEGLYHRILEAVVGDESNEVLGAGEVVEGLE